MDVKEILKTEEARKNFLKGLIRISKADGNTSLEERQFFTQAALALEISQEVIEILEKTWDEGEIFVDFKTKYESLFFIREAIQLCSVDGVYDENEQHEIRSFGEELGIKVETIEAIEAWVREGLEWQARGNELLELE